MTTDLEAPATPLAAVDRYLDQQFQRIKGASSKIGTIVAARILAIQTAHGILGNVAEIGVFEGRFFIALALCAQPGEKAVATDVFTWPDEGIAERFLANCRSAGVDMDSVVVQKAATQNLTAAAYREAAGGALRFIHIDGAHVYDSVWHDLQLARAALHWNGVICLDDVLHPLYPALTMAAGDWLKSHPEYTLFAIVDRESFASACKFMICRREHAQFYRDALTVAAAPHLMKHRAKYFGDEALLFSPTGA